MVRIAAGQGFYGDSFNAVLQVAKENATDYIVMDALAELTLSILQKDKMKDPGLGYARDIELMAHSLYPIAIKNGIKIVSNSGGLNPESAANKVAQILTSKGINGVKIAYITGDDVRHRLEELAAQKSLPHMDTQENFVYDKSHPTHANVYIGVSSIIEALNKGADIIFAGRVADPCLALSILIYHFNWNYIGNLVPDDLNKLASGIAIGHLLECGGQASGGNSYGEWPMDYTIHNLGYPIAHVNEDGSTKITKLESLGGRVSRNTIREQLIYEVHDPANYITPDVTVDFTEIKISEHEGNTVLVSGVKGKPPPEKLKLTIGLMEGYISEQFFFFSWPYAYEKAQKFIDAANKIWLENKLNIDRIEYSFIGLNGIHPFLLKKENMADLNEIGVRLVIKHTDIKVGKMAMQSIICLALNGPPGLISMPGWGKQNKAVLGLWPTLINRELINLETNIIQT